MIMELIQTRDGSHTLYIPELKEHYHSRHGAVSESLHVFIQQGLNFAKTKFPNIRLLEVGMGTGLNAALTYLHAQDVELHYTALEPFPPDAVLVKALDYGQWVDEKMFTALHELPFDAEKSFSPSFHFKKLKTSLQDFETDEKFQLIYYDAFAPHAQPELWTEELFRKLFALTTDGGIVVTYCAKGDVKRALKASGFTVQTLPGAPGKREMVRAIKLNYGMIG